jgi:hypothetical protein
MTKVSQELGINIDTVATEYRVEGRRSLVSLVSLTSGIINGRERERGIRS